MTLSTEHSFVRLVNLGVVVPALNEATTIGVVVRKVLEHTPDWSTRVVVTDNGSEDDTGQVARQAGAEVVLAIPRGYGRACLRAIEHLSDWPDVLLFLDADGSSRAAEIPSLLTPIQSRAADLVIGCRPDRSAMTLPQHWGTQLAISLIRFRWGHCFRDMGPFRAIRHESYCQLGMQDQTWGWTVEMQILAVLQGLSILEVPVSWLPRQGGVSKISGTLSGVARAGARILWTIGKYALRAKPRVEG